MQDIEANEGSGGEDQGLIKKDESDVQIELQNRTTEKSSVGNTVGTEGNTDLHKAVLSVCEEGNINADGYTHIVDLMNKEDIELNKPNKEGYTAIGYALKLGNKTCVEHMLRQPLSHRLYLDYYPGESESTVRELIMLMNQDLQTLPTPLMERLESSDSDITLLGALQSHNYETFEATLNQKNSNARFDEPYYSTLLEIACQMKNRAQFVALLLDHGADPNTTNIITGMPLLHATARSGNFEVLEILLKTKGISVSVKDNEEKTIFHWLASVSERAEDDKERIERCFKSLLQLQPDPRAGIEMEDSSGKSALSIAVEREFTDRIIILLENRRTEKYDQDIKRILSSSSKSLLEDIFDHCFDSNNENVTFKIPVIFHVMKILFNTKDKDLKELFRHPVAKIYVNCTWKKVRHFFIFDLAFYVVFLLSLTTYVLFCDFFNISNSSDVAVDTNDQLNSNDTQTKSGTDDDDKLHTMSLNFRYILMFLLCLLSVREGYQIFVERWRYIRSLDNLLEVLLIGVTFISCSGISMEVRRHFFAIAILLGWFELVLLLGRLPTLSVQMEMLKTVSLTFLKYMMGYIVLLLAFAFSFYILFKRNVEVDNADMFADPFISLVKTLVMFTGEFDFSGLHFDTLPGTSHVIFLLFVFFVAIVLLNLLNGLAVSDTSKIKDEAETLCLYARIKRVTFILNASIALPEFILQFFKLTESLFLCHDMTNEISSTDRESLSDIITERMEKDEKEKLIERIEKWKRFADKVSLLESKCDETQKMLKRLMTHQNVPEPENILHDS